MHVLTKLLAACFSGYCSWWQYRFWLDPDLIELMEGLSLISMIFGSGALCNKTVLVESGFSILHLIKTSPHCHCYK